MAMASQPRPAAVRLPVPAVALVLAVAASVCVIRVDGVAPNDKDWSQWGRTQLNNARTNATLPPATGSGYDEWTYVVPAPSNHPGCCHECYV